MTQFSKPATGKSSNESSRKNPNLTYEVAHRIKVIEISGARGYAALKSYGAATVGTRAEVLEDTGKNRNFPCVLFAAGDSLVPAAAWVLVTLQTLLS